MLSFVDTHCHLDAEEFAANRDDVVHGACCAKVNEIWLPAVSVNNFPQVKQIAAQYSQQLAIYPAYGIHPLYLATSTLADLSILRQWLEQEKPIAVGEIGLDSYQSSIPMSVQLPYFIAQMKLACHFNLPMLIHSRHAVEILLQTLKKFFGQQSATAPRGIIHAFNGSLQQAQQLIKLGFKLGFGGACTYSGSRQIRRLVKDLPLTEIVLETDAPDIHPAWLRQESAASGQAIKANSPQELATIAAVIAEIRGISLEELAQQTSANARSIRSTTATECLL